MSDPVKIIRELLQANSGVTSLMTALPNGNFPIFGGVLAEEFDPTSNPGITISVKGGTTHSEMPLQYPSVQVTCWAGVNQFVLAREVYGAVFAALHGLNDIDFGDDGRLISCVEESVGQDITDPDAGWVTVVNSFQLRLTALPFAGAPIISGNSAVLFGGYL